jgi:hypothetical protein
MSDSETDSLEKVLFESSSSDDSEEEDLIIQAAVLMFMDDDDLPISVQREHNRLLQYVSDSLADMVDRKRRKLEARKANSDITSMIRLTNIIGMLKKEMDICTDVLEKEEIQKDINAFRKRRREIAVKLK